MSWKNEPVVKVMMVKGEKGDKGDPGSGGGGGDYAPNPVQTDNIERGAVTAAKLAKDAVVTDKIGDLQVTSAKLANGAVTTAKIGDLQVTTGKIGNRMVTGDKIAFNTINGNNIVDGEIDTTQLADGAVTEAKLSTDIANAATYAKLMSEEVINVRHFGAEGDGVTDDTTAFNTAFAYAHLIGGGVVFIPAGTYIIGGNYPSKDYVEFYSNTHIVGVPGATVLKYPSTLSDDGATGVGIQSLMRNHTEVANTGYTATENVVIEGITFDGGEGLLHKSTHLGIGHAKNIVIRNCVFKNKQSNCTSTHYLEFNAVKDGVIENCSFYPAYHYAMDRDAAGAASDEQQRVYGEYINIDVARPGAYGYNTYYAYDGAECDGVEIRNCYFESYPSNHFIDYPTQPYIPYAIGGHYADETHGWFETSKNVHIYDNYFLGDWNVGRINGSSATLPPRRYTINANYMTGSVDYWSIHDNVFKSINTGSSSTQNKLPCGILLNTTGTHNFIYDNTFINYTPTEIFYHGAGVKTYDSAQTWNNVNIATDGTVTLWANLTATPYVPT